MTASRRRAQARPPFPLPRAAAGFCLCMVAATTLAATDEPRRLEQITVTAERTTLTAPGAERARLEAARVPGGANVVAIEDYARGRASNLAEVFATTPGVFAQPRFGSEEARLSIRGSGLQRTFHLRGVHLFHDGVPLTLADGSADFQAIEPLALAYTEVLRGANAFARGAASLGGAIDFISPTSVDGANLLRLDGGSFGFRRALAAFGDAGERIDGYVTLSAHRQDGFRDWSRQRNVRVTGNLGWHAGEGVETRLYVAAVDSDSQLPGALTWAQLRADPTQANAGNLAGRQKRDFTLLRIADRTVVELPAGRLEISAAWSAKDLHHPIFQVLEQRSDDGLAGLRWTHAVRRGMTSHEFTLGAQPSWNSMLDDRFVNVNGEAGARTARSRQRSRNLVAWAEDRVTLGEHLSLAAGAQWMQSERRYVDRFLANGDQGLDATYVRWSPRLGVMWSQDDDWSVFANLSDSFEPPSFGELSGGPGVDLLRAQHARTAEIGTRGRLGRARWDLALYDARVRGELLSLNDPTGQPLGTLNVPRTRHRGVELGATIPLAPRLEWHGAAMLNDFRFDGHALHGDRRLPGIPARFHRGELRWRAHRAVEVDLTLELSSRTPVDVAGTSFAPGHAVWGLRLAGQAGAFDWHLDARNLGDERYAATTGVIADARGQDLAQFYPGDGRSVYLGLAWRLPDTLPRGR